MMVPKTYTVESVTSGHPDKICDQISDALLDAYLTQDPYSRVAIEAFGCHGLLVVGGEVTSRAQVDVEKIAREVYRHIGHKDSLEVITRIVQQSPDIAQGVDTGGAGDQGIMYGFACHETPEQLPQAVVLAHALARGLERLRREHPQGGWIKPDGKTQVTIKDGKIQRVLVSTQHTNEVDQEYIREFLMRELIHPLCPNTQEILINPTGTFIVGGFAADTGLTGRKIMVDTYGGIIPHGGGAFSGKDATKVDRSAAYMARFIAKNLVANGYASSCLVSLAYAIGRAEPLMIEALDENSRSLASLVQERFDCRPQAIIERLGLRQPIFAKTATYGHFGKPELPWEQVEEM